MKVANPLYDVVFKYLMQDMRVAKLVISNIIEQEHRKKLETLLSIFDQSNASKESKHFLDVLESSFPDEFKVIIRRLHKASANKELCEDMEMEDEILEELATQERVIAYERAERRKAEAEKDRLEKLLKQAGIEF